MSIAAELEGCAGILPGTGRIVFQDDFEATLFKWIGSVPALLLRDTSRAFIGEACLKVQTRTNGTQNYSEIILGAVPSLKHGLELWFTLQDHQYLNYFDVSIEYDDGVKFSVVRCRFQATSYINVAPGYRINGKWQYRRTGDGVFTDVPGGTQSFFSYPGPTVWYHLKLVGDHNTKKYVSLTVADKIFDLSTLSMLEVPTLNEPSAILVFLRVLGITGHRTAVWFDNVIVTDEG